MNVLAKQRQKQKLEPFFGNQKKGKERKGKERKGKDRKDIFGKKT